MKKFLMKLIQSLKSQNFLILNENFVSDKEKRLLNSKAFLVWERILSYLEELGFEENSYFFIVEK